MDRKPPALFDKALPERVRAAFGELRGVAWVIDVEKGRIAAATVAGLRRLGLSPSLTGGTLDGASPALVRLREVVRDWPGRGRDAPRSERLIFWSPAGPLHLLCEIAVATRNSGTTYVSVRERSRKASRPHTGMKEIQKVTAEMRPLLSELAHELRTPIGAIAAAAEIMKDERFGPVGDRRYAGYVAGIYDSACHAIRIVERVLADKPALLASGLGAAATDIDVNVTLESIALQVRPLAESAGLELALDLAAGLPHVAADATSLRQIVINLLTNALKFTQAGGRVRVSSGIARDGCLEIAIEDSGSGMSKAEIARTMGLAPASAPKRRRAGGGLGLGLPLARALAEANGATLILDSERGRGTKARIRFGRDRVRPG